MLQLPLIFEEFLPGHEATRRDETPKLASTSDQRERNGAVILLFKPKIGTRTTNTQGSLDDLVDSVKLFM